MNKFCFRIDKLCFTLKQNLFHVSTCHFIYENATAFVSQCLFIYNHHVQLSHRQVLFPVETKSVSHFHRSFYLRKCQRILFPNVYENATVFVSQCFFIYKNITEFYFHIDKFCFVLKQNLFHVFTDIFIYENISTFVSKCLLIYKSTFVFCICIIFKSWSYKTNSNLFLR